MGTFSNFSFPYFYILNVAFVFQLTEKIKVFMGSLLMKNLKLKGTSNLIQNVDSVITS